MKKLLIYILYLFFFVAILMVFLPKQSLYFAAERELQNNGIILSGESLTSHLASLQVDDATLYTKGIESAHIGTMQIKLLGLYNSIELHNITLSKAVESFFPKKIEYVQLRYTIADPLHIVADAHGGFGEAHIVFDLRASHLRIDVQPSQKMKREFANTLRELRKNTKGGYSYEQTFK